LNQSPFLNKPIPKNILNIVNDLEFYVNWINPKDPTDSEIRIHEVQYLGYYKRAPSGHNCYVFVAVSHPRLVFTKNSNKYRTLYPGNDPEAFFELVERPDHKVIYLNIALGMSSQEYKITYRGQVIFVRPNIMGKNPQKRVYEWRCGF
jgi:hypothetical protein